MKTKTYFYLLLTLTVAVVSSDVRDKTVFYDVNNITSLVFEDADWLWANAAAPDGWYMPLMSRNAAKQLSEFIGEEHSTNSKVQSSPKKSKTRFCPRHVLREPFGILKGFDGKAEAVKYVKTDPLIRGAFNFTFFSERMGNRKGSLACSLTDNSSYIVIVRIWENHESDWIALSVNEKIAPEKLSEIINHVKVLGLDVDNVTWNDYTGCDYQGKLDHKGLKMKNNICKNIPQKPQINFQKVESFMKGSNYMPLMSSSASLTIVNFLTGKSSKKIAKDFCPVSTWEIPDGFVTGFQYYRNVFTTNYSGKNNSSWYYELESKYPSEKTQKKRAVIVPVWTEFRNYLLMISCWQDGKTDWILYSKRKLLDLYTKKFVLAKVNSIGFNTNDVLVNKYTHCYE